EPPLEEPAGSIDVAEEPTVLLQARVAAATSVAARAPFALWIHFQVMESFFLLRSSVFDPWAVRANRAKAIAAPRTGAHRPARAAANFSRHAARSIARRPSFARPVNRLAFGRASVRATPAGKGGEQAGVTQRNPPSMRDHEADPRSGVPPDQRARVRARRD